MQSKSATSDSGRFNIVMDDRVYKLKAVTPQEADRLVRKQRHVMCSVDIFEIFDAVCVNLLS